LAATGLNIYVSELDLFAADDTEQLNLYKKIFPLLYEYPAVRGVTLWGYRTGDSGITT
jgi:endo-1,4-beta-xylanase